MKVIIVEDDAVMANMLAALLLKVASAVLIVDTLAGALAALAGNGYELVALDLYLTDSSVANTLASIPALKSAGHTRRRVLVLSANLTETCVKTAIDNGADACISKSDINFATEVERLSALPLK